VPYAHDIHRPPELPDGELEALLGGKGANLAIMTAKLGLPVPPGFTITTAACREYLATGWPSGLDDELRIHVDGIGEAMGRRFGDATDPLLVSVRSGAPVSMPGMMDTILDLGLNVETTKGLAAVSGDPGFASDCRRRLSEMYRGIVGSEAPEDPWAQLRGAIEAVFRSWNGERARVFRRHEGIPDDLGTAATVQAMVFGNRGRDSATGVLFTRNPATGEPTLYGDVLFGAQGEDVVSGRRETQPLAVLEERLPGVAGELRRCADVLERHYADLCDIEFTIEEGRLWLLQVRVGKRSPQAALRIAVDMAADEHFPLSREAAVRRVAPLLAHPPRISTHRIEGTVPLTVGLPASPGVVSGEIITTPDAAETAAGAGRAVILVRSETSPEDVRGMSRAAGILTARGGLASHAAVVARGWGIPAVVGATAVTVTADGIAIDGTRLPMGATITIDGGSGDVFAGVVVGSSVTAPEALVLLQWARELGIGIGEEPGVPGMAMPDVSAAEAETPSTAGEPAADDALHALLIKGALAAEGLALTLGSTPEGAAALLDELVAKGLGQAVAGAWRLTGEGRLRALDVIATERERLGAGNAAAALERFVELDTRVKESVSAWQLRPREGEQVLNDHLDPAYDASVLHGLNAIHAEAIPWLRSLSGALPRFDRYRVRLGRAMSLAREGDVRYVASPRVDSYHSVWFELHEDLIRLAGRTRSAETAAGRA
jgi:pyruvate,orthophosphate dikinase